MIGKLKGIIDNIDSINNQIIIDVNGVGYSVIASANTINLLPGEGNTTNLIIETHVREDHIHLYGFANQEEKQAFILLTKVNGVGTKMAITILSILTPESLATAIAAQDKNAFTQISGVGPKLATRLINELKDKFSFDISNDNIANKINITSVKNTDLSDAILALTGLGYSRSDAYTVISKLSASNQNMPLDDLIKEGLKILGNN
jgi:Holliday junction DNA helicase RuvA